MNPLNNLKNEAQQIRLSENEKASMRAHIFGAPSPVVLQKSPYITVSHYHWFSARFMTAMAAVMIVVLGGGTVYAAQGALPGDTLYTVKVSVAEPVRAALAFSDEAKLSVHTDIAEERLEEAQSLAAEGRLSVQAAAQIESSLETHVAEVETLVLKVEEMNPDVAAEVSATLESALAVNSAILASLGDESDDSDTKQNSRLIASRAQSRIAYARSGGEVSGGTQTMAMMAPGAEVAEPALFMATSVSDTATVTPKNAKMAPVPALSATATEAQIKASAQMEKKAEKSVSDIKNTFVKVQSSLEANSAARIKLELDSLDERMKTGDELETMGDYTASKDLYVQVYKDAIALSTFLKAEQKFNKKILNTLLNDRFGVRALDIKVEANGELEIEKEESVDNSVEGEIKGATTSDDRDSGHKEGEERDEDSKKEEGGSKGSSLPIKVDLGL